ncbi:LON peptidase substrate-binding domain-containing protein [Ideonella sp. A 288]|uniref:LON peptidase substrate-binding domain-containing protein n=1 Tax=Ideonella sp. A 288 TaxID=1962181 RepID=UPI002873B5E2|nr:LON peptidase substrate-binding domain-containing protein [Ideonella sp. A 288]
MKARTTLMPALPLFPLKAVLFPGGLLRLKVFEARYLDLVSRCLRDREPFGVVCLRQGGELQVGSDGSKVRFEGVGVLAHLLDVDAEQAGILQVSCQGGQRFRLKTPRQRADGLWFADADLLVDDDPQPPSANLAPSVAALSNAIEALSGQGQHPFIEPHHLDDAGWVANRWCEILPISLAAKQKLMELDEPALRLQLVDDFLRGKGVV